jgi:hypothetical protein
MIKRGTNKWAINEQVKSADLNDTFGGRGVKTITQPYTPTADDDVIIIRPQAGSNTYINVPISNYFAQSSDQFLFDGNTFAYFGCSIGSTRMGRLNVLTGAFSDLGAFGSNGITSRVLVGTDIFFVDYTSAIKRFNTTTGVTTTFATCPANVYAICGNPTNGDLYAISYTGRVYKITSAGVVTTIQATDLYSNTIGTCYFSTAQNKIFLTNNITSYSITTAGAVTTLTTPLPYKPATYRQADDSIYYKKNVSGFNYFCKYSFDTMLESLITLAQYSSEPSFYDGAHLWEMNSSSQNQMQKILLSTAVLVMLVTLPDPATMSGKEFILSAPYGFTTSPFISGKMLVDRTPTNTNNTETMITLPYSGWSQNTRTVNMISDGTHWIMFRS